MFLCFVHFSEALTGSLDTDSEDETGTALRLRGINDHNKYNCLSMFLILYLLLYRTNDVHGGKNKSFLIFKFIVKL